ncbi:MAG: AmmeMemoRadiSam system protein A [bacterium]
MKPYELAKLTVEKYITEEQLPEFPQELTGINIEKAGTFVCIKTKDDNLRGCIGTIFPTKQNIIEEIIYNSISAATADTRFQKIQNNELNNLKYSVDVLYTPEKISLITELDPKIYGIIVVSAKTRKQALLLPDLDGIDTVESQISACMRKAGIPPNEPIIIHKFKVERYAE